MSRINDALRRARQAQRKTTPPALTPLPPVAPKPGNVVGWLLPGVIIFLIVAAFLSIGLALATRTAIKAASQPGILAAQEVNRVVTPAADPTPPAPSAPPVPAPAPSSAPPPKPPKPPEPKLQGIVYATTRPWAIVDGQTVRVGDRLGEYRVKAISPRDITLEQPDGLQKKLSLNK